MTQTKPALVEDPLEATPGLLAIQVDRSQTTTRKGGPKKVNEPTMRALRRILGDSVLDVFPEDLIKAVDSAYDFWRNTPDSYLITDFGSETEKADALAVMRAYSECAGDKGYTIRVLADDDPRRLVWRAQPQ